MPLSSVSTLLALSACLWALFEIPTHSAWEAASEGEIEADPAAVINLLPFISPGDGLSASDDRCVVIFRNGRSCKCLPGIFFVMKL